MKEKAKQLDLFATKKDQPDRDPTYDVPLSRAADPSTSKDAAAYMVSSGKISENQAKVLAALVEHPASTHAELAQYAGLDESEPARRLPELARKGLVFAPNGTNGKRISRKCTVKGTECGLWWASGTGMDLVEKHE